MTDGADDDRMAPARPVLLDGADRLDVYAEDEDVVTQQVAALVVEPRWLVQFTSLDRRLMETSELIGALLSGTIRHDTLVWRGGMEDWLPVGRLDLLAPSAIPTLPPQRRDAASVRSTGPASAASGIRAKPLELTLAALAIAVSAATITTSVLSIAGVFEARDSPTRVQALRAEPAAQAHPPAAREQSAGREQAPGPPDADRATAVAH
jgi:hypothetical protein